MEHGWHAYYYPPLNYAHLHRVRKRTFNVSAGGLKGKLWKSWYLSTEELVSLNARSGHAPRLCPPARGHFRC
jgi:hypothetical protein